MLINHVFLMMLQHSRLYALRAAAIFDRVKQILLVYSSIMWRSWWINVKKMSGKCIHVGLFAVLKWLTYRRFVAFTFSMYKKLILGMCFFCFSLIYSFPILANTVNCYIRPKRFLYRYLRAFESSDLLCSPTWCLKSSSFKLVKFSSCGITVRTKVERFAVEFSINRFLDFGMQAMSNSDLDKRNNLA